MTTPASVLDAVVSALRAALEPVSPGLDAQTVDVRATDDLSVDVGDVVTLRAPAVIVSVTTFGEVGRDLGPLTVDMSFVARCYARVPSGPSAPSDTRGDVAMNLAALVAQTVEGNGIWAAPDGAPVVIQRATALRVQNATTRPVVQRGHALWTVTWAQLVELTRADEAALLHAFRTLQIGIGGTLAEPGDSATIELEGLQI